MGIAIEQKLLKALKNNKSFQELCTKNDVWVEIKPVHTSYIKTGLDVKINAGKVNEKNPELRKNVINHLALELYENHISSLPETKYQEHAENIVQTFIKNPDGLEADIKKFFEKTSKR